MTGDQPESFREINVVPLVDVMLVLLIVFMATAPLLTQGLHIEVPSPGGEVVPTDGRGLDIAIDADGRTFLDGEPVEDLARSLAAISTGTPVSVRADRGVRYEVVAEVISRAQSAGFERVTLVVDRR